MEDKNSLDLDKIKQQFLEEFRNGKYTFYQRQHVWAFVDAALEGRDGRSPGQQSEQEGAHLKWYH